MAKYRKKPVVIDAVTVEAYIDAQFRDFVGVRLHTTRNGDKQRIRINEDGVSLTVETLEGDMIASPGDYIITGVKGERYPCKPDIFEATYERADGDVY